MPRGHTDLMFCKKRMRTAVHQASVREHDTYISKENNVQVVVTDATLFQSPRLPALWPSVQLPREHAPLDFSANHVFSFFFSVPSSATTPWRAHQRQWWSENRKDRLKKPILRGITYMPDCPFYVAQETVSQVPRSRTIWRR